MKPKKLTIKGFRSFKNYTEILFPDSGLVSIQGLDVRTGAKSGTGKSSILEAICFVLGINDLPATELKNFDSDEIEVSLEGTSFTDEYHIFRSSTKLELTLNGTPVKGSKPDIKKRIAGLMGGDEDLFRFLSYRRQLDRGLFFHKEDSILKGILAKCFPELEKAEEVAATAKKALSTAQAAFDALKSKKLSPETLAELLVSTGTSEKSLPEHDKALARLEEEIKVLSTPSKEVAGVLFKLAELKKPSTAPSKIKTLRESAQELKNEIKEAQDTYSRSLRDYDKKRESLKHQVIQLASQKKDEEKNRESFLTALCPTCGHSDEALVKNGHECTTKIGKITEKATSLMQEARSLAAPDKIELDSKVKKLESEIADFDLKRTQLENEVANNDSVVQGLNKEVETLSKTSNEVLNGKQAEKKAVQATKAALTQSLASDKARIDEQGRLFSELEALEKKVEIETAVTEILGKRGLSGLFFSELLADASKTANKILEALPNTADVSITLAQMSETASGTTKNRLVANFLKGNKTLSFRSLSGGQQTSASFAVDLALTLAVKKRCHIPFDFLILDEPMDGMGKAEKEAAIEILRTMLDGRLIILIDHATEINELFDQVIRVEYDGFSSKCLDH